MKRLSNGSSVSLDFIRAAASQAVMIGHGISFCGVFKSYHPPNFPWIQNISVVVFFILSGFLISYSMAAKKENSQYKFRHYFVDRFSRIYTAFVPALAFVLAIDLITKFFFGSNYRYERAFNIETLLGNLLQFQDFPILRAITSFGSARPFWTLAVEWWIYMFVGYVVFYLMRKDQIQRFDWIILSLLSIIPIYNFFGGRGNGLMLFWLYGTAAFVVWNSCLLNRFSIAKKIFFLFLFGYIAGLRVGLTLREYDSLFAFCIAIMILLIVELASNIKLFTFFTNFSKYIASFSYTLYLTHYSVFDFLTTGFAGDVNPYVLFCIGVVISNLIAIVIGRPIETYMTTVIKDRMYRYVENF
ncbi:acyltransferase family protein [Halodesulfovibrio marinisediminis]|uniref:Peptidoglycan/LPS O-acetylase OafA/YrhL, contains acyltransferase and SGNH-hydrolase domains n=1 Tax=Halodesulfovibrio marinisediminis DSM 17456 TaxID=1121457 RepID=A0A1N6FT60_9BACT|nr:acyltransferase [Halodesulfovibrio marinisediminis]SIN98430.1 Peptidoglycan/LPS O-acetylase OafA/YrhL, contains acyltransferase and SGNH-hydrolase domains [Halodesulfovibrio marinisediminis DSM 17456]